MSYVLTYKYVIVNDSMNAESDSSFIEVIGRAPILASNVAKRLRINKGELALTLGLSAEALRRRNVRRR